MNRTKAEQAYIDYVCSNASPIEKAFLSHHGILGQKWGIRRFQNKDGTRTKEGKKRYSENSKKEEPAIEKTSLEASLEQRGYVKGGYNGYEKTIKSPNANLKELTIMAEYNNSFGEKLSEEEYCNLLDMIEKNYNNIQDKISKGMADGAFEDDGIYPWSFQDSLLTIEDQKKSFIKNLGTQENYNTQKHYPGYAHIEVMGDGYGAYGIDDGGAYGDHYLTTEINWKNDWKNPKVKYFSIEG